MRILVAEDKEMHRKAAEETLSGHEITIVKSFDEAMDFMAGKKIDEENLRRLLAEEGFPFPIPMKMEVETEERQNAYWKAFFKAEAKSVVPFAFEVVLTDMMMPMSRRTLSDPDLFDPYEQAPYGFVIALRATLCGAKFVAMVTDTNHHKGLMSAAIDHLGTSYYPDAYIGKGKPQDEFRPNFIINGAKVMFVHTPFVRDVLGMIPCDGCKGTGVCRSCEGTGKPQHGEWYSKKGDCCCRNNDGKCTRCEGTGKVEDERHERKDWGRVLRDLIAE